jgi:hypothetical protein
VEEVEAGYGFSLYDYRNDLDVRSLLAAHEATPELAALDARFSKLLTAKKVKVWESDVPEAFWIYGYPKGVSAEFKEDLQAEGIALR